MVKVIDIPALQHIISRVGLSNFFVQLIQQLENDFARWNEFHKSPRHATHYPFGVIELMPIADEQYYAYKFVNGHPRNTQYGIPSIAGTGALADVQTGFTLMIAEMNLLTAFRTAATSALAAKYMARPESKTLGIIGTGAQSEFQILALATQFNIQKVLYFDLDPKAEKKFTSNLESCAFELERCDDIDTMIEQVDIITTATAAKNHQTILSKHHLKPGLHINAIGGDCPGKTEMDPELLDHCQIVVELSDQSLIEGEIQHRDRSVIHAELWELINKHKSARHTPAEITLFDSVGFALEDYSALVLVYQLAKKYNLGQTIELLPTLEDPKNLFGLL